VIRLAVASYQDHGLAVPEPLDAESMADCIMEATRKEWIPWSEVKAELGL